MSDDLRSQCTLVIPGHKEISPADHFSQMAAWCEQNNVQHDIYGDGDLIQSFEKKVADLLGYEAGLFVMTGTLTQITVMDLVARLKNNPIVGMHETSHIMRHEGQNYQLQQRFNILPLGNRYRPWTLEDLKEWPDQFAGVLYELPMREIGGQLPSWQELESIKSYCQQQDIHLHMDGARLWESTAYYGKAYRDIAQGFNSTYVSLYKGLNGLGGSMLLGDKDFITLASKWMKRQGGNVYHRTPYVVSGAMQFDERLALMPTLFERTKQVYSIFNDYPQFAMVPKQPQSNMLHLILPVNYEKAVSLRDTLAREQGIWIGRPQITGHPEQALIEWYVGDTLLELADDKLRSILDWLTERL